MDSSVLVFYCSKMYMYGDIRDEGKFSPGMPPSSKDDDDDEGFRVG